MQDLLIWIPALIASLILLVKSADYFTEGAENVGLHFGLSSFIVGATIVSIGSSMPEIVTSTIGVLGGKSDFAVDNIIGSNIANILFIGGVSGVIAKVLKVHKELISVDLPFFFLSTAMFVFFISDGIYDWKEGLVSLLFLAIFIGYTLSLKPMAIEKIKNTHKLSKKDILLIISGVIGIYFGADWTITSVYKVSELLYIPSAVVTIFAVAIGTSLPELIISVKAIKDGKHALALGNIFGSNMFNALAVASIPSFFGVLTVSSTIMTIGIPFLIIATLGFIFVTLDNKIVRWEAIALLVVYIIFIGKIIGIL